MLFPVVPDMFIDGKYDCILIKEVHDELIQTQKFKTRYPWIRTSRPKFRVRILSTEEKKAEETLFQAVNCLCEARVNKSTGRMFDLSREDKKVISHTLALGASVSTGDNNLSRFVKQEFPLDYKGDLSALEVLVVWIQKGFIEWTREKQAFLLDWANNDEPVQPASAKRGFTALTGFDYVGT